MKSTSCGRGASSDETTCTRTFVLSTVAIQEEDRRRGSKQGSSEAVEVLRGRNNLPVGATPRAPHQRTAAFVCERTAAARGPVPDPARWSKPLPAARLARRDGKASGSASQASWRYRSGRTGRKKRLAARRWASGGCRRAAEMVPRRRREIVEPAANPGPAVFSISLVRPDGFGSGSASGPARGRGRD